MSDLIQIEFVNREEELHRVDEMRLGKRKARILLVKAAKGMGKTWLLRKIMRRHNDLQASLLSLSREYAFAGDPIEFVHNLIRQVSGVDWSEVEDLLGQAGQIKVVVQKNGQRELQQKNRIMAFINRLRAALQPVKEQPSPAAITFGDHAHVKGDVFTGDKIEVNLNAPDDPNDREHRILITNLSEALFRALRTFRAKAPLMMLLDDYDEITATTRAWLLNVLLPEIRDGNLPGVMVVIAGIEIPEFDRDWRFAVEATELKTFPEDVVLELWTEIYDRPEAEVGYAMRFSRGQPYLLAQMADNARVF